MAGPNAPRDTDDDPLSGGSRSAEGASASQNGSDFDDPEDVARRERIEASIEELRAHLSDVQELLKSLAGDMMDAGRETAASYDDAFRRSVERQPYTSILVATLIGFVLGSVNTQGQR